MFAVGMAKCVPEFKFGEENMRFISNKDALNKDKKIPIKY